MCRTTDCSSRNAVNFSSARTTKRFPSPRCASATKIVCPRESKAETQPQLQPALLRLSAMISQYFTRTLTDLGNLRDELERSDVRQSSAVAVAIDHARVPGEIGRRQIGHGQSAGVDRGRGRLELEVTSRNKLRIDRDVPVEPGLIGNARIVGHVIEDQVIHPCWFVAGNKEVHLETNIIRHDNV